MVPAEITDLTRRQEKGIEVGKITGGGIGVGEIDEGGFDGIILSFSAKKHLYFTVPPAVALLNYEKP